MTLPIRGMAFASYSLKQRRGCTLDYRVLDHTPPSCAPVADDKCCGEVRWRKQSLVRRLIMSFKSIYAVCALLKIFELCTSEPCYGLKLIASRLRHPIAVAPVPGRKHQLLLGEHRGIILLLLLDQPSQGNHEVFLDISSQILTTKEPADERGLLSFVLDPEFPKEKSVYVCYSSASTRLNVDHETRISQFLTTTENGGLLQVSF